MIILQNKALGTYIELTYAKIWISKNASLCWVFANWVTFKDHLNLTFLKINPKQSSMGKFQLYHLPKVLVNVYNYCVMVKTVYCCCVYRGWLLSNPIPLCIYHGIHKLLVFSKSQLSWYSLTFPHKYRLYTYQLVLFVQWTGRNNLSAIIFGKSLAVKPPPIKTYSL